MGSLSETNILVFDVGGSHASAALVQGRDLQGRSSSTVDSDGTAVEILGALEALGKQVLSECGLAADSLSGVSLGFPNPFDYENGISYIRHKFGALYGQNLRADLAARFGIQPQAVTFVNDASAYMLGEIHFGAAAGVNRVIGITLGTGVGSAFAVDGNIVTHGEGVPNEGFLWNAPYEDSIVEEFVSSRAIRGHFYQVTGEHAEVSDIARRSATEVGAMITMQEFGKTLGTVLKKTCRDFRPDAIVLGGAISRSAHLFLPAAQEQLSGTGVRLLVSQLFDDAALLGASIEWRTKASTAAGMPS